jgi:hypothetical protein
LTRGKPLEKLLDQIFRNKKEFILLKKLTLPKTEAPALLKILADEGVSAASVFPGYDGVAEAVFERGLWDENSTSRQMRSRWKIRRQYKM